MYYALKKLEVVLEYEFSIIMLKKVGLSSIFMCDKKDTNAKLFVNDDIENITFFSNLLNRKEKNKIL